ncbi:MAG: DNA-formamidopyrimidine glycosylase [Candidatus Marinimicrobia bacterium]|nr:DNA-formamidopyrimidine glycosylase [Candidatus Neomarinimicrobiota bacterium]
MPELPEVETIVLSLRDRISGKKINKVVVQFEKCLGNISAGEFKKILTGAKIISLSRRAKYIIFELSNKYFLFLHLRMTGKVLLKIQSAPITKHDHVMIYLNDNQCIFYNDTRKFGRFFVTQSPEIVLGKLGPEPLGEDYNFSNFSQKITKTQRTIKALLLDQTFVAGLGNIYTDEALWMAKIHPEQPAHSLSKIKRKALFEAIKCVLTQGIANRGTSLGDGQGNYTSSDHQSGTNQHSLKVFARTGSPCPECRTMIQKSVVAQRGTHYCPKCQKLKLINSKAT